MKNFEKIAEKMAYLPKEKVKIGEVYECFESLDLDPGGNLTVEIFLDYLDNQKEFSFLDQKTKEEIFFAIDKDNDGQISISDVQESLAI